MGKKPKANGTGTLGTKPRAISKPPISRRKTSNPIKKTIMARLRSFVQVKRFGLWRWGGAIILTLVVGVVGNLCANAIQKKLDQRNVHNESKADLPQLEKRFPGGFKTFGVSATHNIIRDSASYGIDMTWDSATISELTASNLTMQLQNVKIIRTQTTPAGTQSAGSFVLNGKAIWKIDRRTKLVSINNAVNLWGFVIGGYVFYDKNDVLIVAVGLQKVE